MLDDLFVRGLQATYQESYEGYQSQTEGIVMEVNSNGPSESYAWLGSVPRMRVFNGERKPLKLGNYKYAIENEEYEASLAIDLKDVHDDQTGKYGILAGQIGESSAQFSDELLFGSLLPNGFSTNGYDGQYFFDTDHAIGASGTQSNLTTLKLGPTGFGAARTLFYRFKDDQGRPMNATLDLVLIIPPELLSTAEALINTEYTSPGVANPYYHAAEIRVNAWLTDVNAWYLINKVGTVKAFVKQNREYEPLAILGQDPSDSTTVVNQSEAQFMRRKVYTGTYWRGAVGYGLFQKAVASTGATGTQGQ
jgi:phage major head subunit gpT-like protein